MNQAESRLFRDLRVLVDETAPEAEHHIDLADAETLDEAQGMLEDYFNASQAHAAVNVMVGTIRVGTATRQTLDQSSRTAAEPGSIGEIGIGERIQLPGTSARYRLLKFACPACPSVAYRIHYDERLLPSCATDGNVMGLQRGV